MQAATRLGILIAAMIISAVCGVLYAWSIFVLPLEQMFGWGRAELSFTFTLVMFSFGAGMFGGGFLLARIGPRLTVLLGALLLGAGLFLAAQATSLLLLYLGYGGLAGAGIGIVNIVPTTVCLRWYPEKKGLISGVLTMTLAFGTLLIGSLGAGRLLALVGVQETLRLLAITLPAAVALCALFLRLPETGTRTGAPVPGTRLGAALRTSAYRRLWLWGFLIQTGGLMLVGHLVPFARGAGFTAGQAAALLGLYSISNGLGRLFFGFLLDRFGRAVSMSLGAAVLAGGLLTLIALPTLPGIFCGCAAVGLAYGGTIPHLAALCMTFFGPAHFPVIYGSSSTASITAALCGPYVGGVLFTLSGSYTAAFAGAAGLGALSLIPMLLLRRTKAFATTGQA